MIPKAAKWTAGIIVSGAVAVFVLSRLGSAGNIHRPVALPDGTVLTLEKVSFGTEHHFQHGTFWQRQIWRLSPALGSRLNVSRPGEQQHRSSTPALCLFFYRSAAPSNSWPEDLFVTICDENGVEYAPGFIGWSSPLGTGPRAFGDERLEVRYAEHFPRRAQTLLLRAYSWSRINAGDIRFINAGEVQIPNPAFASFPVWTPEPLPTIRRAGDLEVTLTNLEVVVDPQEKLRLNKKNLRTGLRAGLRITNNGELSTNWEVESIRLGDATGNSLYLWSGAAIQPTQPGMFVSPWRLGLDEPAWRLRVELSRQTNFTAQDLCIIKDAPVIPNPGSPSTSFQATIKGTTIGFQKVVRQNNWSGNASIEVQVSPKTESFRIALLKVIDDRGRNIEIMKPPVGYGDFRFGPHYFGIQLPADSKTLTLTFARRESRFVEFTAKPKETLLNTSR